MNEVYFGEIGSCPRHGPLNGIWINHAGGACPCQVDGTVEGYPFYFRARHGGWTLEVAKPGQDPVNVEEKDLVFFAEGDDPDNGYMPAETAVSIIIGKWREIADAVNKVKSASAPSNIRTLRGHVMKNPLVDKCFQEGPCHLRGKGNEADHALLYIGEDVDYLDDLESAAHLQHILFRRLRPYQKMWQEETGKRNVFPDLIELVSWIIRKGRGE